MGRFINADVYVSTGQGLLGYNMFSYCGNNPVMGYDPTGCWNWGGFWAGVAITVVGVAVIAATIASAGAAAPLAAAAISAVGTAVGVSVTATGVVTSYAAATETPMVVDTSFSNGDTHDKHGYSIVIDFDSDSVSFDTYYHYGKTKSGYSAAYGVGFVYGYDGPGDYGGYFLDGGMTYSHNGIDYGFDVCTDPSAPFEKCSALMMTTGVGFPGTKDGKVGGYLGVDYYLPVSYIVWG